MDRYLLWHSTRVGWVSASGTTTDIKDASRFSRDEALARVERHKDFKNELVLLPVREEDIL